MAALPSTPQAYVLDYLRTARGKGSARGSLYQVPPQQLVVALAQALTKRTHLDPVLVRDVVLGVGSQVDEQGANIARAALLLAGWPDSVPAGTVSRFCASGIDAVSQTAGRIRGGDLDLAIAGGVESTSRVPIFSDRGPLWTDPATMAAVGSIFMGVAADLNATIDGWTRGELDAYGLETQRKATAAWDAGWYDGCVVPAERLDGSEFERDELMRPQTTAATLAALEPAFAGVGSSGQDAVALRAHPHVGQVEHLHTVGTSPPMADGAALLLVGNHDAAEQVGLRPRARIVAVATAAADPVLMLTAGQQAVTTVIAKAGLEPRDIDVFEFAEAFAALCLRFRRDLDAGPDRMNPGGGTIAMGHAFGATGAIMVGGCVEALEHTQGRYGVAAVSAAAGLGVAVLLERVVD